MERVANHSAAELLMPSYLFDPFLADLRKPTFASFEQLADSFGVSRTAAAIRAVERGHSPAILSATGQLDLNGRFAAPRCQTVGDR